jgi:hypothetical protein
VRCERRRTPFEANRKRLSKEAGKRRASSLEFWYRAKYNLTATDPRFLAATIEEMAADYWAWFFKENPKATIEDEDEDFNLDEVLKQMEENPEDWVTLT